MRILVLSFYYPPDLGAGSFRAGALVASLREVMPPGSQVDVVTTLPNRYHTFTADVPAYEDAPGLSVRRVKLRPHQSGMLDQSAAFLAFGRGALAHVANRRYDLVFATSSRLMTAMLGARIARRQGARLYLDIRDIFADTIKDVLPGVRGMLVGPLANVMERRAIARADSVNLVSGGFLPYFRARYPDQRFTTFTNGIDDAFLAAAPATPAPSPRKAGAGTVTVLYAGNIGEGQGLHTIVPQLAAASGASLRLRIIGDGGRLRQLEAAIAAASVTNVELVRPIERPALIQAYRDADVLFLHLNNYPAFEKVLPSKVFEYAAMGKPILAGVAGYAATFVRSEIDNASVFDPNDVGTAVSALDSLVLVDAPRPAFTAKYARATLSALLAADVLGIGSALSGRPAARQ